MLIINCRKYPQQVLEGNPLCLWFVYCTVYLRAFLIPVCRGARLSPQSVLTTTSTLPPPITSLIARSPVPLTIIQDQPTAPSPPVCADATDVNNPLGRLRSAMRNSDYTQMNAYFDAFLIFYSDEHLVRWRT